MRVYERDAGGSPKFVGENAIGHTPQGSELAVKIGDAFDVTVQPTLVSSEAVGKTRTRYAMSYRLRNARGAPVSVELRQGGLAPQNTVVSWQLSDAERRERFETAWATGDLVYILTQLWADQGVDVDGNKIVADLIRAIALPVGWMRISAESNILMPRMS